MARVAACVFASVLLAPSLAAAALVWPVSGTATPDVMNTSFGPRVNYSAWDFHDGMDLPYPTGTPVVAVEDASVYREGPGGTDGYSSRHVVLRIDGVPGGPLYAIYLHLSSIAAGIVEGGTVTQGQVVGAVGADGATYPHLHFEMRLGTPFQIGSVHPLGYLPYADTANFSAPVADRFQVLDGLRAARFRFQAASKLEGDLARVEVDVRSGAAILETRVVDLDDKTTIHEGNGDALAFLDDIALEGYQASDMVADGRTDLHHGIVVRHLPAACDALQARVIDVGGNVATGPITPLPVVTAFGQLVDFEDGAMPPPGWQVNTSSSGTGTTVANAPAAAHAGTRGMACTDLSTTEGSSQTASIAASIPAVRLQWVAEAWVRPDALGLGSGQNVYVVHFRKGTGLSVAATLRGTGSSVVAGIATREPDGTTGASLSPVAIATGAWRRFTLELLRLGTRETTAVLHVDGTEAVRRTWDGAPNEADGIRAGIGFSSTGATAVLACDDIRLSDQGRLSLPTFAPGRVPDGATGPGTPLTVVESGPALALAWGASCNVGGTDYAIYEGTLGAFGPTAPVACSTGGAPLATILPSSGPTFYLVVPRGADREGSYGVDSADVERPPSGAACVPQLLAACAP